MTRNVAACVLAVVCCAVAAHATVWTNCGTSSDHINVNNVVMTPDPPVRSTAVNITMWGVLDEKVTDGNMVLSITYAGMQVYTQSADVCTLSVGGCPLSPGNVEGTVIVPASALPPFAPPGTYSGNAKLTDQNGQELACIDINFTL